MVLDKLLHLLEVDCCWVQLLGSEDRNLRLVASRGFTPEMARATDLTDSWQSLSEQAIAGLKVIISDLSRDGQYGLSPFGRAGLRSLVAVPIRTYRTHGVLGIASRTRKRFTAEAAELLMAIAGLIGAAHNTAELSKIALDRERQLITESQLPARPGPDDGDRQSYSMPGSRDTLASGESPALGDRIGIQIDDRKALEVAEQTVMKAPGRDAGTGHGVGETGGQTTEEEGSPPGIVKEGTARDSATFRRHVRRMVTFRRSHKRS